MSKQNDTPDNDFSQLPLFAFQQMTARDDRPLPLIVAEKWGFDLTHIVRDDYLYLAIEWYTGLGGKKSSWSISKTDWFNHIKPVMIEVKRPRRKPEMLEFVDARGLFFIAAQMTARDDRPQLNAVKDYLAEAGVRLDDYRLNPESAVNDAIGDYENKGKSATWIEARTQGIIARKVFVEALKNAVLEAPDNLYAMSTEKLYSGLWQRTMAGIRNDLGISPKANVRDHMSEYALIYTRLAEMVASDRLKDADTVPVGIAMEIVYKSAEMMRGQALATANYLGIDAFTGKKLLGNGEKS